MAKYYFFLVLIVLSTLIGCASSNYFINKNTNLNGYKYIYVAPLEEFDEYGILAFTKDLFAKKNITVVSKNQSQKMNISQTAQTLFCQIEYDDIEEYSAVVNLYNYKDEEVYNGQGMDNSALSDKGKIHNAIENALEGFYRNYTGFNSALALDPKKEFENWEKINLNEDDLKYELTSYSDLNPLEGIWSSVEDNQYSIGIVREKNNNKRDFVAFILYTSNPLWEKNQVKIEFKSTAYKSVFSTTYYMSDHSKQGTTAFINDNGILEIKLSNPEDNSKMEVTFIKNYPAINEDSFAGINNENTGTFGTGFIVSENGLIATNWHVVENNKTTEVYFPQIDKTYNATTILKDSKNDIAILKLNDFSFHSIFNNSIPFTIAASSTAKQGIKVFTLGFPLGDLLGQTSKLSDGIINSLYGIQDDPRLMQISNPIQPGNSGGPLFNYSGEIIGIVVATLNAKYFYENTDIIPQNVNFAVKSDYLLNLSAMLPEDKEISQRTSKLKGLSLDKQVEMISPFIVSIKSK